jgi:hypothetical protein
VYRVDDPFMLAEILHTKGLAKLRPSALAPTVLASTAPVGEALAALRAAGYAPSGENADGTVALERPPSRRAEPDEELDLGGQLPAMLALNEMPEHLLRADELAKRLGAADSHPPDGVDVSYPSGILVRDGGRRLGGEVRWRPTGWRSG